jgi:hypothetical protein
MNRTFIHLRSSHSQHNILWLIAGISGICGLGLTVNTFDPILPVPLMLFFISLSIIAFCFTMFLTNIVRRSLLVSGGVIVFFSLRFIGLREWYYVLLLVLSILLLEKYFNSS